MNSSLISNTAPIAGGGIANFGGDLTIKNSIISNNSTGSPGGGIYNEQKNHPTILGLYSRVVADNRDNSTPANDNCRLMGVVRKIL